MKHIFIINPKSGKHNSTNIITQYIEDNFQYLDYNIYITQCVGDATKYVESVCKTKKDHLRFYACGGDGTLNEVVNGAIGYDGVSVACYPCGSGNDFIKMFNNSEAFYELANLIEGKEMKIDLLKVNDRYVINICNLGFDASVAYNMLKFKKWPLVTGHGAYNMALIYSLLFKMRQRCTVLIDGETALTGDMLLSVLGNGICCGGGYYCLPRAVIDDGIMDAAIVKSISRIKFIKMVKPYKDGTYVDLPKYQSLVQYRKIKKYELHSDKDIIYSLDGECGKAKDIIAEIVPNCLNLIIPKQSSSK